MEAFEGTGWRTKALTNTQFGTIPRVETLEETDKNGKFRRIILNGFGVTNGVTIIVGSSDGQLQKFIGMPLGATYLYLELKPQETLKAVAFSVAGSTVPETLNYRVEVLR